MNYRELYVWGKKQLETAAIKEAAWDARLLLEHVCHTDRHDLLAHGSREVEEEKAVSYKDMIARRAECVPLQYITGTQEFMGLEFLVNEHVLIPRQDTEILVEEALKSLHDGMRLLDMCTGSGCILLSLLHYSNDCAGTGVDISQKALLVAKENADRLSVRADFVQSDLFEAVPAEEKYDMILANPPYIRSSDISGLMEEVKGYEPRGALDGGDDGLIFYRRISRYGKAYLRRGGFLFYEIGWNQSVAVTEILEKEGYREIRTIKDFAGLDRVVCASFWE